MCCVLAGKTTRGSRIAVVTRYFGYCNDRSAHDAIEKTCAGAVYQRGSMADPANGYGDLVDLFAGTGGFTQGIDRLAMGITF
jgi:hypothetical protein